MRLVNKLASPSTLLRPVMMSPMAGSVDLRSTTALARRPVTTIAEGRVLAESVTPVPLGKALIRTAYDPFSIFMKKNDNYRSSIRLAQESIPSHPNITFFWVGATLWAAGVDATKPEVVYQTVKFGALILGVTPEQLGDIACVKNLNHESDDPQENMQLHGAVIDSLTEVRKCFNPELFSSLEITSNAKNPKFTRANLLSVLESRGLSCEVVAENLPVVSVNNAGDRDFSHLSSTVRVDLDAAAPVAATASSSSSSSSSSSPGR